jgi:hypothetical protein
MTFSDSCISNALVPELSNSLFNRFSDIGFSVDDPYPVVRVESDRHEYGVWIRFTL